jgi:phosphate-selective porin OprO/OprP
MDGNAPRLTLLALTMLLCLPLVVSAQQQSQQQQASSSGQAAGSQTAATGPQSATFDDRPLEAGFDDDPGPPRELLAWNHYRGKYITARLGGGFLFDYIGHAQDQASKEQFSLFATPKVRDTRLWLKGGFPRIKREVTYTAAVMYEGTNNVFLVRETGIMIATPEISGSIFIGRTKEGFSLNKIMVGYAGWTMERATISDATIPILADGIKWLGYAPKKHLLWNLGVFGDEFSEGQSFSTYDKQAVGRIAWVPMESPESGKLLHIGLNLRYGRPNNGNIQFRSRPEAFTDPYFIDTGKFPARDTKIADFEVYYRPGSLLIGTEYFLIGVNSPQKGNPFFHGGEAVVTWIATGEVRDYRTRGGIFEQVSPKRPVSQGGPGAWEFVNRFSYSDLDSGPVQGGVFWRYTPQVNWYLSNYVRLEFNYGYGTLNRFNLVGKTQWFQTRLQLQF